MISCVVVLDGRVTRVVYDHTHQWFLESCVKFSKTAVMVVKNSFRNLETVPGMGRLIFRAFQCEMALNCAAVSRLLLVPAAKVCESIENWF